MPWVANTQQREWFHQWFSQSMYSIRSVVKHITYLWHFSCIVEECNIERYCTLFGLCWKYTKCLVFVIIINWMALIFMEYQEMMHSLGSYCTCLWLLLYDPSLCNIFWYSIQGHSILYNCFWLFCITNHCIRSL